MLRPTEQGQTLQAELEAIELQTKVRSPMLDKPEFPNACAHVWDWFTVLSNRRGRVAGATSTMPLGITPSDMRAYFDLIGAKPLGWELDLLLTLDEHYCTITPQVWTPVSSSVASFGNRIRVNDGRNV